MDDDATVVVAPLVEPESAIVLTAPHGLVRIERTGNDVTLTGYHDTSGLEISQIDLSAVPRIASTVRLDDRYESEGRSHAFNSLIEEDGSGLMGLPTVRRKEESGRWWWWSESSDVSFVSMDAARQLTSIGALTASEQELHPSYQCEVSCIDWYGNARPIFTDGRVFALSGVELIEGRLKDGVIAELRRVDLSAPPGGDRLAAR